MSVAIHFAAKVSVSETTKRASPRAARKEFTFATRSDSSASMLAAALGIAAGHATNKQAMSAADTKTRADLTGNNPSSTARHHVWAHPSQRRVFGSDAVLRLERDSCEQQSVLSPARPL